MSACRVDDPAVVWAALAPLLAGRPRVRESRDGGRNYAARWERPLTDRLPRVPAAVPIYSGDGCARVLVVDLDVSRGGREAVLRDAAAVTALVARCGGRVIADESPSGGVHVYVPLAVPVPFHEARDVALALASRTPCMDATPNVNLLAGLIRPPGSVHKLGGHQVLRGSLAAAHEVATVRNPASVWQRLTAALAGELAGVVAGRTGGDALSGDGNCDWTGGTAGAGPHGAASGAADDGGAGGVARRGGPRELTGAYLRIATTGIYDTARYRSPSEARQAVITSAVWAGMSLPEVIGRIKGGAWPGLAALYARYAPRSRGKALAADWRKAVAVVARHQDQPGTVGLVRKSPTSAPPSHRAGLEGKERDLESGRGTPGEYRFLRTWWSGLRLTEHDRYTGRGAPGLRMVLRALGEAGLKTGSRYVAFGTRSVALATGLDHTTVAAHLRTLRDEADPLVVLIENDRGLQGDLYELRIPDTVAVRASRVSWPAGKLHALRPVFRALGLPAAFVYEALEAATSPVSSFELAGATRLARSTVYEALETLASYHLAEQRAGRWHLVAGTSLTVLAEQLGCISDVANQLARYRVERAAYRAVLGAVHPVAETIVPDRLDWLPPVPGGWYPGAWPPPARPAPADGASRSPALDPTVLDLLQQRLGARIIA